MFASICDQSLCIHLSFLSIYAVSDHNWISGTLPQGFIPKNRSTLPWRCWHQKFQHLTHFCLKYNTHFIKTFNPALNNGRSITSNSMLSPLLLSLSILCNTHAPKNVLWWCLSPEPVSSLLQANCWSSDPVFSSLCTDLARLSTSWHSAFSS